MLANSRGQRHCCSTRRFCFAHSIYSEYDLGACQLLLNVPNIVGLCFLSAVKLEAKIFDYSSFIIVVIYHMTEEKVVVKAECCRPVDKLPVTLEKCFLLLNLGLHFLFGADISVITTPQSAYASLWECKIQPSESAVLLY